MTTLAQLHALLAEQQQAIRPQIDARIAELLEEADKLRGQIRDIDSIIKLIEPRTDGLNLDLAIAALEAFTRPKTLLTRFDNAGTTVYFSDSPHPSNACYVPAAWTIHVVRELLKAERARRKREDQA